MEQMVIIKDILRNFYECDDTTRCDVNNTLFALSENGGMSKEEFIVANAVKEQYSMRDIANLIGISDDELEKSSAKVYRIFDRACAKLANALGEDYQDSKVLKSVERRLGRSLTKEEIYFCVRKITDFRLRGNDEINIYNFEVTEDGRIIKGEDRRKR